MPDARIQAFRRQVARHGQIVRQRIRLKSVVQSILHTHLILGPPVADLFGRKACVWLAEQHLLNDERLAIERHLREREGLGEDLAAIERDLARRTLQDEGVQRLLTITGVNMAVAVGIAAAIGDVTRFISADKRVCYFGRNPRVRRSGLVPARHSRITKRGPGHARGMLAEAAWAAARIPSRIEFSESIANGRYNSRSVNPGKGISAA